jgi:hypothetical protein
MATSGTERRTAPAAQFGLGCLHLVPREAAAHETPVSAWLAAVAETLRVLPGVDDVAATFTPVRDGDDPPLAEAVPWFAEGRAAASGGRDIDVSFRLKVTRELLAGLGPVYRGLGRWPRDIRVRIDYVRGTPVMIAWSTDSHDEATGTTALDIVRLHLAQALAGTGVMVDVLEPTPFPADLRVFPVPSGEAADQLVQVRVHVRPGFDLIDVTVDTRDSSFEDMLAHVLFQAALEADDYYRLVLGVAVTERLWDDILARFNAFVAAERGRRPSLLGSSSAAIRELMLGFVEAKAAILAEWHELSERVEKARASDVGLLSAHIVDRYARLPEFPFDEYMRMLDFLEGRRTHRSDAQIAIISAIIGGLIGSLYVLFY